MKGRKMENITYTYRVVSVGDRSMDVEYSADGFAPLLVGVPRPRAGDSVEAVIQAYSPVNYWLDLIAPRADVEVGVSGEVEVRTEPPSNPGELMLEDLPNVSHAQIIAALIISEVITEAEGNAWIAGTLPAAVEAMIAQLPEEQQVIARLRAIRPTYVSPTDPMVGQLAIANGNTVRELIDIFLLAASL